MILTRRALLGHLSIAGALYSVTPRLLAAAAGHEHDWDWLLGNWDVYHERLRDRLVGSTTWDKFAGKSSFWTTLGGFGNVDDNLLYLPAGAYRAISVRTFDPARRQWSIWWLDGRTASKVDPPVIGGFSDDEGEFQGADVHKGTPVTVRFRWHEIHGKRPWWDQGFSTDGGKNWEINWRNYFTRTSTATTPIPLDAAEKMPAEVNDWKFLVGRWRVRNRRRNAAGSWEEFDSTLHNWPVMGGLGNVGDNVFNAASGAYRGKSLRAFDTEQKIWRSWWLDGRDPSNLKPSLAGTFRDGIGTLIGEDELGGKKVQVRSQWSKTSSATPHWEQATSADGKSWDANWVADFLRVG